MPDSSAATEITYTGVSSDTSNGLPVIAFWPPSRALGPGGLAGFGRLVLGAGTPQRPLGGPYAAFGPAPAAFRYCTRQAATFHEPAAARASSSRSSAGHRYRATYRSAKAATASLTVAGAASRASAASAASKHLTLTSPMSGSVGPCRAAHSQGLPQSQPAPPPAPASSPKSPPHAVAAWCQRPSAASMACWEAASSSSSAATTAAGTIHPSPAWASITRYSRWPRGRTGGNSVDRW